MANPTIGEILAALYFDGIQPAAWHVANDEVAKRALAKAQKAINTLLFEARINELEIMPPTRSNYRKGRLKVLSGQEKVN